MRPRWLLWVQEQIDGQKREQLPERGGVMRDIKDLAGLCAPCFPMQCSWLQKVQGPCSNRERSLHPVISPFLDPAPSCKWVCSSQQGDMNTLALIHRQTRWGSTWLISDKKVEKTHPLRQPDSQSLWCPGSTTHTTRLLTKAVSRQKTVSVAGENCRRAC